MRRVPVTAALLLMVGGFSFQVRGNGGTALKDSTSAGYFANRSAEKNFKRLTGAGPSADKPPGLPLLVSQLHEAKQHRVVLSWNSSAPVGVSGEDLIAGYNVYRRREVGTVYTQYIRINSDLVTDTSFVDDSVRAGRFYDYQTTAVNNQGVESGPSNQIRVEIPFP